MDSPDPKPKTQDARLKTQDTGFRTQNLIASGSTFLVALLLCAAIFFCSPAANLPASSTSSTEVSIKTVWVFFTDKGYSDDVNDLMYRHETQLSSKTRERRWKAQGSAVDVSDLPVYSPYIDGVLQLGATLRVTSRWLNGITAQVPDSVISQIRQLPYVSAVESVITYRRKRLKTQDPRLKTQDSRLKAYDSYRAPGSILHTIYGASSAQIHQIKAEVLHDKGYHGEGIIIALLDTGFDISHEALKDVRVLKEYDFVNNDDETSDNPPEDDIGQDNHGTEILSIIAGYSPGNFVGVAYAAEYLLAKTERVSQNGVMFEQRIEEDWWVAGLEWAELNGADIVSSSLGYSDWYSYSNMNGRTALTTIAANMAIEKGMSVVVSAGNEGKSLDWPYISAPADGFHVIAVGAVDEVGEIANFSSIGPTYDGRIKPDVVAMGNDTSVVNPISTIEYRKADGTSMATPLVAGTLALLLQAMPDHGGPAEMAKLLKFTASRASFPDNRYGWGIINAEEALRYGTSPDLMREVDAWDPSGATSDISRVIIYPNPVRRNLSDGRLNIYSPEFMESITIYSLAGQLIYERQDMGSARFSIWDLKNESGQDVASGIYICIIRSATGVIDTRKIAVIE